MNHSFVVSLTRFHRTDPDRYVLQGYYEGNTPGKTRISARLDGLELPVETGVREGLGIRQKYFSRGIGYENIDREYDLWITLPENWRQGRLLQVFQIPEEPEGGRGRCLLRVGTARLAKERRMPDGYLETFRIENGRVYIGGWAVGSGPCRFKVTAAGQPLKGKVTWHFRQDVVDCYPEAAGESFGYELSFDRPAGDRVSVTIAAPGQRRTVRLNLNRGIEGGELHQSMTRKASAYLKRYGLARTLRRAGQKLREGVTGEREGYMAWRRHVIPSGEELQAQRAHAFADQPLISIVVPLYKTERRLLEALIESVRAQTYGSWELCLSDGSGENSPLEEWLRDLAAQDGRIRVVSSERSLGISENTNQALRIAGGDWIVFADHDDLLPPWALYEVAREVNEHPEALLLYSDEDKVSLNGRTYFQPHFKSDFNPDLLCSMNYFCHLVAVSRTILERTCLEESGKGWLDPAYDGAQDYDFVLRCVESAQALLKERRGEKEETLPRPETVIRHIPRVLYHWRSHPASTSGNPASKLYAFEAGRRAVQAHLDRTGIRGEVLMGAYPGLYRVRYEIPGGPGQEPLVSVIIPNKDHAEDLRKCVGSVMERSAYRNLEFVVVENGSQTEELFAYYEEAGRRWDNFRVVTWNEGFNYSAINNFGAAAAKGDFLLFLNNDTELTDPDLISELVGPALRPEVGAVGAKLLYEDGTIQHAGVIIGYGGIAGHAFQGMGGGENGYFSRIICQCDLSAVTAACMLVRREVFEAAGGFDPVLAVAFNDIDFCLRLREMGYLIVYNPFAVMNHYESRSRGMEDTAGKIARFNREADELLTRWGRILKEGDPYYNPNLSLDRVDFGLKKFT